MCISHEIASWERTTFFSIYIYIYPNQSLKTCLAHPHDISMEWCHEVSDQVVEAILKVGPGLGKPSQKPIINGDSWKTNHKQGDDLGMVHGIGFTTSLLCISWEVHGHLMEIMIHEDKTVLPLGSRVPYLQTNPDPAWMVVSSYGEPPFPSGFLMI